MLAIQDAFWLIMSILIASIIAACFIRMRRQAAASSQEAGQSAEGEVETFEAPAFE
jgi:hypothetical protein